MDRSCNWLDYERRIHKPNNFLLKDLKCHKNNRLLDSSINGFTYGFSYDSLHDSLNDSSHDIIFQAIFVKWFKINLVNKTIVIRNR